MFSPILLPPSSADITPSELNQLTMIGKALARRRCQGKVHIKSQTISLLIAKQIATLSTSATVQCRVIDLDAVTALVSGHGQLRLSLLFAPQTSQALSNLASSQSLTTLKLNDCDLGSRGLAIIASSLHISRLYVTNDKVGIKGTTALAAMRSLTSLTLDCCQLEDKAACALTASTSITALNVTDNLLTDKAGVRLASMPLRFLDVSDNTISTTTLSALAKNSSLTSLSFDYPAENARPAALALAQNLSLKEVRCEKMDSQGALAFAQSPTLTSLSYASPEETFSSDVAAAFGASTSLRTLELGFFNSNWKIELQEMVKLSHMQALTRLSVVVAEISNESLIALSKCPSLRELSVTIMNMNNHLPLLNEGIQALALASLEDLHICANRTFKLIDGTTRKALAQSPSLRALRFDNCCTFTPTSFAKTFGHNHNLLRLKVENIDDKIQKVLTRQCRELTQRNRQHRRATEETVALFASARSIGIEQTKSFILPLLAPGGALRRMFDSIDE